MPGFFTFAVKQGNMWQVQSIHKCSKCGSTDSKRESKVTSEHVGMGYIHRVIEQTRKCNECGHKAIEGVLTTQEAVSKPMRITIPPPEYVHLF